MASSIVTTAILAVIMTSTVIWLRSTMAWNPRFASFSSPQAEVGPHVEGHGSYNDKEAGGLKQHREFREYGCAADVFVEFGSYRSSSRDFAIVGLSEKLLHDYGNPTFSCEWIPNDSGSTVSKIELAHGNESHANRGPQEGVIKKYLPDYSYNRVYRTVVVTCSFDSDVGLDGMGGQLILNASRGDSWTNSTGNRIVAVTEKPGDFNATRLAPPYPYEFAYCGGPLYGNINARRVQEWIAYHDMLFQEKAHFILYDAGVREDVLEALSPWIRLGRVSVQDVRATDHFNGHYHNHFMLLNDCLYRSKFMANWTFYFDMDEYLYVNATELPGRSLESLFTAMVNDYAADDKNLVAMHFSQYRMIPELCHGVVDDPEQRPISKQWGFEKLTYRLFSTEDSFNDKKNVLNPRKTYATGVHGAENSDRIPGALSLHLNESLIRYYHYHNTIDLKEDPEEDQNLSLCRYESDRVEQGLNFTLAGNVTKDGNTGDGALLQYDGSMVPLYAKSRRHEAKILERDARAPS